MFLGYPVLLEAGYCVTIEFARTALEGCLAYHAVDVVQNKSCSLWVAGARLAAMIVRHQMLSEQMPQNFGLADFAAHFASTSLQLSWRP